MSTTETTPPRILIFGSCVSRDILHSAENGRVALSDYYARSSIASLGTKPCDMAEARLLRIASEFQRRMVRRDVSKEFLSDALARTDFDVILIDLIDERFDLVELEPGAVATVSGEFLLTETVTQSDRSGERWIRSGSARHRSLWKAGVDRLFEALGKRGLLHRVIVNKVFWATKFADGSPIPNQDATATSAANDLLSWMYAELATRVPADQWITFPDSVLLANQGHRWGIAPFHYRDEYYRSAFAQLEEKTAVRVAGPRLTLEDGVLVARALAVPGVVQKFAFLVFKENELVHKQPYSDSALMRFDVRGATGGYDVVVLVLSFDTKKSPPSTTRTTCTTHYSI